MKQCFIGQEDRKKPFQEVCILSAGKKLHKAVDESKNEKWKLQLRAAMIKGDARLIDVKYNLSCRGHKPATAHLITDSAQTGSVSKAAPIK